jgi:hypothetical protein
LEKIPVPQTHQSLNRSVGVHAVRSPTGWNAGTSTAVEAAEERARAFFVWNWGINRGFKKGGANNRVKLFGAVEKIQVSFFKGSSSIPDCCPLIFRGFHFF